LVPRFSGYSCHSCRTVYEVWPGAECPKCHQFRLNLGLPPAANEDSDDAHRLGENVTPLVRRPTGVSFLDSMLGEGAVDGHAILLYGPRGGGKTTLALQIAGHSPSALIFGAEQPEKEVAATVDRLGIDTTNILFRGETEIAQMERLVLRYRPKDVFVDSLQLVRDGATGRPAGSGWTMTQVMTRLFELAHGTETTTWVISHVNSKGKASGPEAILHWTDVLLQVKYAKAPAVRRRAGASSVQTEDEAKEHQSIRLLGFGDPPKNRGGIASTHEIRLQMTEKGLSLAPEEPPKESAPTSHPSPG
jgi:predicted ATP-dependent serine protease